VIKVTQDFTTSSATFADVLVAAAGAALGFTPAANTNYEVEGAAVDADGDDDGRTRAPD
jgi:hypothetical protein